MELKQIAAVTGRGGLFKIVQPTRTGVILESIDKVASRLVANGNDRVSILNEISIYTTDADGSKPLDFVLKAIKSAFSATLPVSAKSEPNELKAFMVQILPEYDANRVYTSDIKKLVTWYLIINEAYPELLVEAKEVKKEAEETPAKESKSSTAEAEETPVVAKKKAAPKAKVAKKE